MTKELTVKEMGHRGGTARAKNQPKEVIAEIGRKGGLSTKAKGSEYYRNLQRLSTESKRRKKGINPDLPTW